MDETVYDFELMTGTSKVRDTKRGNQRIHKLFIRQQTRYNPLFVEKKSLFSFTID